MRRAIQSVAILVQDANLLRECDFVFQQFAGLNMDSECGDGHATIAANTAANHQQDNLAQRMGDAPIDNTMRH